MAGEQFKFPDEVEEVKVEVTGDDDFEVEVVDDTPEQDRGRKPLEREVEDPTDDEIEQYTQGAQKRIKELTHARHDERRAKEATLRENKNSKFLHNACWMKTKSYAKTSIQAPNSTRRWLKPLPKPSWTKHAVITRPHRSLLTLMPSSQHKKRCLMPR